MSEAGNAAIATGTAALTMVDPPVGGTVTGPESSTQLALETENFIDTYKIVADWIKFADAKAAAVLVAVGGLASVLIPTIQPYTDKFAKVRVTPDGAPGWMYLGITLFVLWLLTLALTSFFAFYCIMPFRRKGRHPALNHCNHFHPAAVASCYDMDAADDFVAGCNKLGGAGLKREVLAALLLDCHISNTKYNRVSRSIRMLALNAIFGFAYLLVIQF